MSKKFFGGYEPTVCNEHSLQASRKEAKTRKDAKEGIPYLVWLKGIAWYIKAQLEQGLGGTSGENGSPGCRAYPPHRINCDSQKLH